MDYAPAPRRTKPKKKKKKKKRRSSGPNWSTIGSGIMAMVGSVIWLVVGLFFGWFFYYPPILFVIGLITFISGFFGAELDDD